MWKTSSYSLNHGACVEADTIWIKSTLSYSNGACVEAATSRASVLVRDSQIADTSPILQFSRDTWTEFTRQVKRSN